MPGAEHHLQKEVKANGMLSYKQNIDCHLFLEVAE
jgi:hypothetical protein